MERFPLAYDYVTTSGIIVPDTSTTLAEVQAEYLQNFGADLDLTPSTPQGVMITATTLERDGIARLSADVANQFNPNLSGGVFLDAICALSGLSRVTATRSTVTVTVVGTSGTIINSGALAETTTGDLFQAVTTTTIPIGGTIDMVFQSVELGAIPAPIGTLTVIVDGILGWTSITNAAAATLGVESQSDLSLGRLRRRTLALQGVQTTEAVISGLYAVSGVQSLQFRENVEATTQTIDTISMVAHSIYVCVNGGLDTDIARSILDHRSAGTNFNGTTTVATTSASGQVINVKFSRPSVIGVLIKVTVRLNGASGTVSDTIKNRILDYANGLIEGEDGFAVGVSVSPFDIAGAVMGVQGVYVVSVEIAPTSTGVYQSTEIAIAINQIASTSLGGIQVVIV